MYKIGEWIKKLNIEINNNSSVKSLYFLIYYICIKYLYLNFKIFETYLK